MPENILIIYEPRKILDLAEKEGKIAPADLEQFGYGSADASKILLHLCTHGYLEEAGHKTVTPAAYFETDDGKPKKVSEMRIQSACRITAKGRNEKPSPEKKYWIELAPLDETDFAKIIGNSSHGEIKNLDAVLAGLRDERGRTLPQLLRDELYATEKYVRIENLKQRVRFAANRLFGRRMKEETPTQK
jgi:hypothetical protein